MRQHSLTILSCLSDVKRIAQTFYNEVYVELMYGTLTYRAGNVRWQFGYICEYFGRLALHLSQTLRVAFLFCALLFQLTNMPV